MATLANIISMPGGRARQIPDNQLTSTVYTLIKDGKFHDVIAILQHQLQQFPHTRASLSLLGYCYYQLQDFENASKMYERLVKEYPNVEEHKVYYAQCLYKCARYQEAQKACLAVEEPQYAQRMHNLQAAIMFELNDLASCRSRLQDNDPHDKDTLVNRACVLFKEGKYEEARALYVQASNAIGSEPELAYNIALCYYKMRRYADALKHIGEIVDRGVREHPELSVGSNTDGIEVRSVGNSLLLKETALVEAFNLKAAIEYLQHNLEGAQIALSDMPPRSEGELDAVTLHNHALMHMDTDPTGGFKKFNFLLQNPPCPPETFPNLLVLYVKYGFFDRAADAMAEYSDLTYRDMSTDLFEFLDATIQTQTSVEEAYRKFEELDKRHAEDLRKLTKTLSDARYSRDPQVIKVAVDQYDEAMDKYLPILMSMVKIYWDRGVWSMVERLLVRSADFCGDNDVWRLNTAHAYFIQEIKFREAIALYEKIIKNLSPSQSLLNVPAIVLANLCVAYIMTSQNEIAEELMRKIERVEECAMEDFPEKPLYHSCIVNLVIGTLYCAKGNFEFGISRVMKSVEPFEKKIDIDTWYWAKRCFLALLDQMAKQTLMPKDTTVHEMIAFLEQADIHGKNIPTKLDPFGDPMPGHTVSSEARSLKKVLLRFRD
eukprot:Rmarinus@m.30146